MQRLKLFLVGFLLFYGFTTNAQEIGGMPVNVAMHAQTFILFPSTITDFDISDKENFTCRPRRDNGLIIIPKNAEAVQAMLVITEGNRTHRLSINYLNNYDPNKHNLFYDLSNVKTLKELSKTYQQQVFIAPDPMPDKGSKPEVETRKSTQVTTLQHGSTDENEWKPLLEAADKAYSDKRYEAASRGYKEVLKINADNIHATNRLSVIEKILEILTDGESQKNNQVIQVKKQYDEVLENANEAFEAGKLGEARLLYTQALNVLPTEKYPNARINLIDRKLEEQRLREETERKKLDEERKLTEQYNAIIAKGETALKAEQYEQAEKWFKEAIALRPADFYAKGRIADIGNLKEAKASAANDKAILDKAKAAQLKYKTQVTKADKLFEQKKYTEARQQYIEVLAMKPADSYAQNRIDDIDNIVAATQKTEKEKDAAALAKKLQDSYNSAIARADAAYNSKQFAEAITIYTYAKEIKPDETYAKNKIGEIENLLNGIAKQAESDKKKLAEDEAKSKAYREAISVADKATTQQQWDEAKQSYLLALKVKPKDPYAVQKLNWIKDEEERLITQKKQAIKAEKDQELKNRIEQAEKLAAAEKLKQEQEYKDIIVKGDLALKQGKYDEARKHYTAAQNLLPGLTLSQEKIGSLNELEAWIKQEAVKEQMREKVEADRRAYQALINEADNFFSQEEYDKSKKSYQEALKLQQGAQYPLFRLEEIKKAKLNLELRLTKKGPFTREMLKKQQVNVPLTQAQLYKAYPNFAFNNPPFNQRLAADYFIVSDTVANYKFSKEVLEKEANIITSDSVKGVAVHLSGIYFNGGNAYLRLTLENFSDKEFLTGITQLTLKTSKGSQIPFHPLYITGFPYLLPGRYIEMVLAIRAASVEDSDNFEFQMIDRLNIIGLKLNIPGKLYNSEFSHN